MIIAISALLAVQTAADPEPFYPFDFDLGCRIWATLADEGEVGVSTLGGWSQLESWCGGIIGTPPPTIVEAELVMQGINQDGPRDWTAHDLVATYALLDTNGDGVIEMGEPTAASLAGASPVLARAFVRRTARLFLLESTDADRDGRVTEAERADLLADWERASNRSVLVRQWIAAAKMEPEPRWSPISPGASFAALGASLLDPEGGWRIDWLRMESWFFLRDMDGDKALSARELFAARKGPAVADLAAAGPDAAGPDAAGPDAAGPDAAGPVPATSNAPRSKELRSAPDLLKDAGMALRCGDIDGAVQRLIGVAWISPESFLDPSSGEDSASEVARLLVRIALPSESRSLLLALQLRGIALDG